MMHETALALLEESCCCTASFARPTIDSLRTGTYSDLLEDTFSNVLPDAAEANSASALKRGEVMRDRLAFDFIV
jgi:hypothetical protein